jgi:small subunit ribosomal protein S20
VPPLSFDAPAASALSGPPGASIAEDLMANTSSAKKATRKIEARTAVNRARKSRVRTFLRKVEEAIAAGDQKLANEALKAAAPELHRAAQKGIFHGNLASRKVARLNHRIKELGA